jgi:hypothetical protein
MTEKLIFTYLQKTCKVSTPRINMDVTRTSHSRVVKIRDTKCKWLHVGVQEEWLTTQLEPFSHAALPGTEHSPNTWYVTYGSIIPESWRPQSSWNLPWSNSIHFTPYHATHNPFEYYAPNHFWSDNLRQSQNLWAVIRLLLYSNYTFRLIATSFFSCLFYNAAIISVER